MKIVINALSARMGGGQTYLKNLLAHLPERPDLELLVYAPESLPLPEDRRVRRGATRWPTGNPLLRALWERLALPGVLARERAQVLFCPGGLVATRAPAHCCTVTMFRNMIPFDARARRALPLGLQRLRNWLLEPLMLSSMARADLTIFISSFAHRVIAERVRLRATALIPHGIGPSFRTHGRALPRPPRAPSGPYLLYVSKIDSYKHHLEVVHAYARLPRDLQRRCPLLLAGETDHPLAAQVAKLRDTICEPGSVRLHGAVPYEDLPSYYQHAEAILFASSCENCPNILLEALASGRPVLSSNVMPMPEFGGDGLEYFSPFDPDDIARALLRVLSDADHARRVAQAALAASRRYDWAQAAAMTWNSITHLP